MTKDAYNFHGKPEIMVGKRNSSRPLSIYEASENMGSDFRLFNFSTIFSLSSLFGYNMWLVVLPPPQI